VRAPLPITDLEIVGYANRLTETMRPAVVPPIFGMKSDPARIFLPPYVIQEGFVFGAMETNRENLAQLDSAHEVTLFDKPISAERDHELWIAQEENPHYEPLATAHAKLRAIAVDNIAAAVDAMKRGKFDEARIACRIALCADDRLIEPLAITAAIARQQSDPGTARLMARLAAKRATSDGFETLVAGYMRSTPVPAPDTAPDLLSQHSLAGIATRRAA